MLRRPVALGGLIGLVLLGGCAVGGDHIGAASPEPRADLAREAEVAAENRTVEAPRKAGSTGRDRHRPEARNDRPRGKAQAAGTVEVRNAAPREDGGASHERRPDSSWSALADIEDSAADHGAGPGHADVTRVELTENDGMLAASVTVDSVVPGALAGREVEGLGVDLFRSSSEESDYQLFLDGGSDGWRAFLQTPRGFVDFPGYFGVEGRTFYVWVPWDSLGGRRQADVSAFVDWSSGDGRSSADSTARATLLADRADR